MKDRIERVEAESLPGPQNDREFARTFQRDRILACLCLIFALILAVASRLLESAQPNLASVFEAVGALLFVALFPFYFLRCNRCPRCRRSFSRAPEYSDADTRGLPLLNRIERCPFCELMLDGPEDG